MPMKIIPFSPPAQPKPPKEPRGAEGPKDPRIPGPIDFGSLLGSLGARDKVGLENRIANETAPPGDLSIAAFLVKGVIAQMGLKDPGELARIHNLDGLIRP
jgi:hypothetical protein